MKPRLYPMKLDSKGFTLAELAVALGIAGVMGLALTSVLNLAVRVNQNTKSLSDIAQLDSVIKQDLANPAACEVVTGAGTFALSSISAGTVMDFNLKKYPGGSSVFIGATPASAPLTKNIFGQILVNRLTLEVVSSSDAPQGPGYKNVNARLHLNISKSSTSGPSSMSGGLGNQTVDDYIPINLVLDSTTRVIQTCGAAGATDLKKPFFLPTCPSDQFMILVPGNPGVTPAQWSCQ